jgi:hypothetical protein
MGKDNGMSILQFSKISGIRRSTIVNYIKDNYPLFCVGKDRIDLHMALVLAEQIRKK